MTAAITQQSVDDTDVVAALDLLALSGKLNFLSVIVEGSDRESAREHRRAMAFTGIAKLSHAFGLSMEVEGESDPDSEREARDWVAGRPVPIYEEGPTAGAWLEQAIELLRAAAATDNDRSREVAFALIRSVIRPLSECGARLGASVPGAPLPKDVEQGLVALFLVLEADGNRANPSISEASAGLARLIRSGPHAPDPDIATTTTRLAAREASITVATNGPYLFEGAADVVDYLGVPLEVGGRAAFCRCGQSASKPFCDGSHATSGFAGDKDAHRIADHRDVYVGQQATVFDNRGLCAHSGSYTDRLNRVFHVGAEPFVTPSGGRLDDIMRAVRRCPSGALGFGIEGEEMRSYTDEAREAAIEISKDGPYRITGNVHLLNERGDPVARNTGGVARTLQPVPMRVVAEQTLLFRHALVHDIRRPTSTGGTASRPCSSGPATIRRCWT